MLLCSCVLSEELEEEHLRRCRLASTTLRLLRLLGEKLSQKIGLLLIRRVVEYLGGSKVLILLRSQAAIHVQILLQLSVLLGELAGSGQVCHAQLLSSICLHRCAQQVHTWLRRELSKLLLGHLGRSLWNLRQHVGSRILLVLKIELLFNR